MAEAGSDAGNVDRTIVRDAGALGPDDLRRLGALHTECIDDSLPALLGPGFAGRLYGYLAGSPREHLLFERVDGRVESAVVVSESPGDLHGRIARALLPHLLAAAFVALVRRAAFRRFVLGTLRDLWGTVPGAEHAPEITYIFTNPRLQGRRLGRRLIGRVDALLRSRGLERYYVKTLDDPANRAIGFYEREGFERIGVRAEAGRSFVEFEKRLPDAARSERRPEPPPDRRRGRATP
jgi:ribosomal protein S18 acetylase RimI-like enzyme